MSRHHSLFLQVYGLRACGAKDGGGAGGPSTVKGKCELVPQKKSEVFSLSSHVGPGDVPMPFLVSYRVGKMLKFVKVCLKFPIFNALGAPVYRPHRVARRWAGRCAERRIAWPWCERQCFFLWRITFAACENPQRFAENLRISMHWGWKCPAPTELPHARSIR